jgi:hypothetical protein
MQVLVIARITEGISAEQVLPYVVAEAKEVWNTYVGLAEKG